MTRRLLTDDERTTICTHYAGGLSIRDIAARLGRAYGTVHGALLREGVELRKRGGDNRSAKALARKATS